MPEAINSQLWILIHEIMVRARLLEERLIKMSKSGEGYFWIGGPGEEAFNVPLGLQVKKGRGDDFDYLHLHYRSSGILLGMGAPVADILRQMRCVATDPYSKGRNFVNHPAIPQWNVVPVSSTIGTQYSTAIGTGIAHARAGGDGITIVNGGDGGTAEGDFHSCLVWANRPVLPLPILIIVVNNGWAISTACRDQHGEKLISDWAKTFNMQGRTIDGKDPMGAYRAIQEAMAYVRKERKPFLLEAAAGRLYGHSSSSGANRVDEPDCVRLFEEKLLSLGILTQAAAELVWHSAQAEIDKAHEAVLKEPYPKPEDIWDHVYAKPLEASYPRKGGS